MDESDPHATAREMPGVSDEVLWQNHKMVAIGRLSGGIAHEFNNLMQGVIASLELTRKLMSGGRAIDAAPFIVKAITSAQNASSLHQRVARFSQPQPIAPTLVSLNAVVGDVEDLLRYSLTRAFDLEITTAADLWTVYCDSDQAEIALVDMILEARDGMPEGGQIAIATRNDANTEPASASEMAQASHQSVCIAVTATTRPTPESFDRGLAPGSPVAANRPDDLAMVDRFARTYGGALRRRRDGPARSTELHLPRSRPAD